MTYEIFQIRCCADDCKKIYDVRTFYKGKPTKQFPCDNKEFVEKFSDGYCPECLFPLMQKINNYPVQRSIDDMFR